MVTFVIFWSAIFAIVFYVTGVLFKALASAFNALLETIVSVVAVGGLGALVAAVLFLLYGMTKEGFWSVVVGIILLIIIFGIFWAIFGGIGTIILEVVVVIAEYALVIISSVLEWVAESCEILYEKLLKVIINRLDRC